MTGPKSKDAGPSEVAFGALIVIAIVIAAALLGGVIFCLILNTLGVAAYFGLPAIPYWAAVGVSLLWSSLAVSRNR